MVTNFATFVWNISKQWRQNVDYRGHRKRLLTEYRSNLAPTTAFRMRGVIFANDFMPAS